MATYERRRLGSLQPGKDFGSRDLAEVGGFRVLLKSKGVYTYTATDLAFTDVDDVGFFEPGRDDGLREGAIVILYLADDVTEMVILDDAGSGLSATLKFTTEAVVPA